MEIGPALPPHLAKKLNSSRDDEDEDEKDEEEKSDSDEEESYGPALPPGFQSISTEAVSKPRIIGPMRPQFDTTRPPPVTSNAQGRSDDDSDDDIIGPRPPSSADIEVGLERTKMDIEARSQSKKDQMSGKKDAKPKRDSWMTELPPDLSKNFGLGPRKFRSRAIELGDQSVWTDTPADKARKAKEGNKGSKRSATEEEPLRTPWELARDREMTNQVENHNKRHRGESLMGIHSKKLEKQKEREKDKPVERRPFDREKDLNLPTMTDGQKKSIIRKSKELGSRFHHAQSGSSFL